MKYSLTLLFKLVALAVVFGCSGCHKTGPAAVEPRDHPAKGDTGVAAGKCTVEQRRLMSQGDRLRWLEQNGIVPEDGDSVDWQLAQQTSWWGKPINSKEFWKDRTVWMDHATQLDAMRRGRRFPPVPDQDERFSGYSHKDISGQLAAVDGPGVALHLTEQENAFWNQFGKTQPMYPEEIEREQRKVAADYYNTHKLVNLSSNDVERYKESLRTSSLSRNYPAEAFTEEALYWAYVMKQRESYSTQISPFAAARPSVGSNWLGRLSLDPNIVTQSLTEEQIKAADAWKIFYLQRLRREKVDETYINAYLKAWNLTSVQVFDAN